MKKILLLLTLLSVFTNTFAQSKKEVAEEGQSFWDFDHKLKYMQTALKNNHYEIVVMRRNNNKFPQMSAFLIRKAHELCHDYNFSIKFQSGIEKFDDKNIKSQIKEPLKAEVICP